MKSDRNKQQKDLGTEVPTPAPGTTLPPADGQKGHVAKAAGKKGGARKAVIKMIPVAQIYPNDFNPNVLTAKQKQRLRKEIRKQGGFLKLVVVRRRKGGGYEIVDGAHNFQAAVAEGYTEVLCQVIEANGVEAMRQGYTRNLSGKRDPVQLGRMFRRMMDEGGLSQRALARKLRISETNVRLTLHYPEAVELRNRNAPDTASADVAKLTRRQVRLYVDLPDDQRDAWLERGAKLDDPVARALRDSQPEPDETASEPPNPGLQPGTPPAVQPANDRPARGVEADNCTALDAPASIEGGSIKPRAPAAGAKRAAAPEGSVREDPDAVIRDADRALRKAAAIVRPHVEPVKHLAHTLDKGQKQLLLGGVDVYTEPGGQIRTAISLKRR